MKYPRAEIARVLIGFFEDDNARIDHAMQVLHHAETIMADYPDCDTDIVIATALLHDVGIKESEALHGYNNGKTQEKYGPPIAERLLQSIDFPIKKIERVKEIVGNHHSASKYDYIELEILKKADAIVNREC